MEHLCRINWKEIENSKELEKAIVDWCDKDYSDINDVKRVDILTLISTHNLLNKSKLSYDKETGFNKIEITIDAKVLYGIKSKWNLTFNFPEFGEHCISLVVSRNYGEIRKEDFYNYIHDITIA
ncbi:hypothetical protein ACTA71_001874 [Dictyostelium dimigraforme]